MHSEPTSPRRPDRPLNDPYGNSSEYQEKRALAFRAREKDFSQWLQANGADVVSPASEYEVIRYRAWEANQAGKAKRPATHVIYRKADGRITFMGASAHHWSLFLTGGMFPDQSRNELMAKSRGTRAKTDKKPTWARRTRDLMRIRDGDECWFCGTPCPEEKPEGMSRRQWHDERPTVEHMLARHLGGTNHIDNLVLAHAKCNRDVGHRSVEDKAKVRELIRAGLVSSVSHWAAANAEVNPPPRKRKT